MKNTTCSNTITLKISHLLICLIAILEPFPSIQILVAWPLWFRGWIPKSAWVVAWPLSHSYHLFCSTSLLFQSHVKIRLHVLLIAWPNSRLTH